MTTYKIYDSYGAPQCAWDVIKCDLWCEVEEYFSYDDEAMERLLLGLALIEEVEA